MSKLSIFDIGLDGLKNILVENQFPSYRGKQIFDWLKRGVFEFDEMKNIPKDLKLFLNEKFTVLTLETIERKVDSVDGTKKFLFKNSDNLYIETVLMKHNYGNTVCISSQCGCRMGCSFCATGKDGLASNLSVSDMVCQVLLLDDSINHIVVMGMGEPFDNYDNLYDFIRLINSKDFINLGQRSITVSTCGILDRIDDFERDFPQVNLAISLHSAIDEKRSRLMPINNKFHIADVVSRLKKYIDNTGRRVTFEYALLKDINDSNKDLKALIDLLRGMNCHVNLIPFNSIGEDIYLPSDRINYWNKELNRNNISTTIRKSLGGNIGGACGQLRRKRIT